MKRVITLTISVMFLLTGFSQESFTDTYSRGLDLIKAHDYSNAIAVLDKAYEIAPAKSQERSRAMWAKGMALYLTAQNMRMDKDYEGAYKKYADAMKCFWRVSRKKDVMDCANSMAVLNVNHFGYKDLAIVQYEYALNLAKELNLAEEQVGILMDIISVHKSLHNEIEVSRYNARLDSLISENKTLSENQNLFFDKGINAFQNGDWGVAISCFKRFLTIKQKEEKRFAALQRIRDAYAKLGDDENALVYSQKCVDDWKKAFANNSSQKYVIYQNHFPFQIKVGDYEGALASIDSIQKSTDAVGTDFARGELFMDRARVYGNIGRWNDAVQDYETADSLFSLSLHTIATIDKLKSLVPLYAGALYRSNRIEDSYQQYLRYQNMMKDTYGEKSIEYANALYFLANSEGFAGRLSDGTRHYIESWEIIHDIATQDLQFLQANGRGRYWSEIKDLVWNMIPYGLAANCQENDFTSSAFEALMFSKGLLLSTEKTTGSQVQDSGDENLINEFTAVANLRNDIERLKAERKGDEVMLLYVRMDSLDRVLSRKLIERNINTVLSNPSTSDIAGLLDKKSVLIDFADYVKDDGTHIYAAVVLRKGMNAPRLIKVFEQSRLDSLIARNNGKYSDLYEDYNSQELYDIILKPLMDEIKGSQTIYFVPSGILNQIAVEAVTLPDGDIMGEKYDIVRLTNSKELLTYRDNDRIDDFETAWLYGGLEYDVDSETMTASAKETEVSPLLAVRGGTSGLKANEGFKKLKMSEAEVIGIDEILTHSKINTNKFMNTLGTEESFVSMSGKSPDLLLLSTHGFYYSPDNVPSWSSLNGYDNPMYLTGLVMSGGNAEYLKREIPDGVMGGLLTSSDIALLDLSGTQLVVLSACETGLGDTTNEGVYGLQRAFKKAGAQTLVMSLWPVSDLATKDFMILFHKELADNKWDKRAAFKNAKKALRKTYNEPYYWAAFIMVD